MPIGSMTYQNIVDEVKKWIKANCTNITNYAGIPSVFKSGYSLKTKFAGDDAGKALSYHTATLTGNAVPSVTASTVDTDMTNFLKTIGVTDASATIKPAEFLDFMEDMISFCSTKLAYSTSQFSTNKYLIYATANTSYINTRTISDTNNYKLSMAEDVNNLIDSFTTVVKQKIRNKPVTYSITFSAS